MFWEIIKGLYTNQEVFVDYLIVDPQTKTFTKEALIRRRIYFAPFLFGLAFSLLSFGFFKLQFHISTLYYRVPTDHDDYEPTEKMITRKEYRALLVQQQTIYAANQAPDIVVADVCHPNQVKYNAKKTAEILTLILASFISTAVFVSPFALIPSALCWWWYSLKRADMKDARIKKEAYEHYLQNNPEKKEPAIEIAEGTDQPLPSSLEEVATDAPAAEKKQLTQKVVKQDLHMQKHSVGEYLGQLLLIGLMIVVAVLGNPLILLMGIFLLLNINSMVFDDIQRSRLKYTVLDRVLQEKNVQENDDAPDNCLLWFENEDSSMLFALTVPNEVYLSANVGEQYYIVVLKGDKTPCLCYRQSEWTL